MNWERKHAQAMAGIHAKETFTPYTVNMLNKWSGRASGHRVTSFHRSSGLFEIYTGSQRVTYGLKGGGRTQKVDLTNQTCDCNKWQIYRIPCSHAIAASAHVRVDSNSYVGHWYTWSNQLQVYNAHFLPLGDELDWPAPASFPVLVPDRNAARG